MASKFVRAPNNLGLIAAAMGLLLLAALGADGAAANVHHYRVPFLIRAAAAIRDAILALALLFVALRKSAFAPQTAVIVATLLTFAIVAEMVIDAVASLPVHVSWFGLS